jgi:2-polyprenyl-3-methyl-5-hydroxy-6-metoxy-1,4-benzoquinol methylase
MQTNVQAATYYEHYEKLPAPVYTWMAGGAEAAFTRAERELADIGPLSSSVKSAVDPGAGFGTHSIPLARSGCRVLAVDTSAILLRELAAQAKGPPVSLAQDDLLDFSRHLTGTPEVVLCLGDTLPHLQEYSSVTTLITSVADCLSHGGRFVITLRDYSKALAGIDRFIPVMSDNARILTCFLEYAGDRILVHDILHELHEGTWTMHASACRKLRLQPHRVRAQLENSGFAVDFGSGPAGMIRFRATRY